MDSVKRIFVEKKSPFAVKAKELKSEIVSYLGIEGVTAVRVLIRYDVENVSADIFEKACNGIFSEPPVDVLYHETMEIGENDRVFGVEYLPGQFDQRADSALQCIQLLKEDENPIIKTAITYVVQGKVTDEEFEKIKNYCVNPVDSQETVMEKPATLETRFAEPDEVEILEGFRELEGDEFKEFYDSLGLAMTKKDLEHIRQHFREEEKRDPSMTEIRVLDTYWSDHCRHTTFSTELKDIEFIISSFKDFLSGIQIALVSCFYRCSIISIFKFNIL